MSHRTSLSDVVGNSADHLTKTSSATAGGCELPFYQRYTINHKLSVQNGQRWAGAIG